MDNNDSKQKFEIAIPEDMLEGVYSNLVMVSHSALEFSIDFAKTVPCQPKAKVKSRVIMSPFNAKRLSKILSEQIAKYEERFGKINSPNGVEGNSFPAMFSNAGEA